MSGNVTRSSRHIPSPRTPLPASRGEGTDSSAPIRMTGGGNSIATWCRVSLVAQVFHGALKTDETADQRVVLRMSRVASRSSELRVQTIFRIVGRVGDVEPQPPQ